LLPVASTMLLCFDIVASVDLA